MSFMISMASVSRPLAVNTNDWSSRAVVSQLLFLLRRASSRLRLAYHRAESELNTRYSRYRSSLMENSSCALRALRLRSFSTSIRISLTMAKESLCNSSWSSCSSRFSLAFIALSLAHNTLCASNRNNPTKQYLAKRLSIHISPILFTAQLLYSPSTFVCAPPGWLPYWPLMLCTSSGFSSSSFFMSSKAPSLSPFNSLARPRL